MTATASLKSPSPRMTEKRVGCSSNLMIVTAAIMSELQKMEQMKRTSIKSNSKVKLFG